MHTGSDAPLVPQLEENILEARWMSKKSVMEKVCTNTFSSIANLMNNYFANH
jgi:hypothetical protein